jgi:hypothetical protein
MNRIRTTYIFNLQQSMPYGKIYHAWIVTYNFSINMLRYTIFVVSYSHIFDILLRYYI